MNNKPTPETDALDHELHSPCVLQDRYSEMRDHARKMERERDKAREDATNYYAKIGELEQERDEALASSEAFSALAWKLEKERNEAREALAATKHYLTKERDDALAQIVQAECRAERFCQERDEAREALREWQTLRLWGAEPQHIHDFIKGQQARIHESQDIEKTCEQLERERDEAREALRTLAEHGESEIQRLTKERDEARDCYEQAAKTVAEMHYAARGCVCGTKNSVVGDIEDLRRERDELREENKKLIAFVESLVDALGPHTDINGSSVIPAAYAILRNIKEARK